MGHIANQINAMPVAPAAESQKREIVAKLNDLAAQMKVWAGQVEGFALHLNALSVQPQNVSSPSEARGAPIHSQPFNAYNTQQYSGSQQYQFQTSYQQYSPSSQSADYQLSKVSPAPLGPGSAVPDELEKTGKRRRRADSTRKKKDPLAPKRPPSAYILYQNDVRKQMQDKYPGLSYSDVLGKISESWQALEESRKKVYMDMVERDKLRYEDEKTRYNAGQDIPTKPTPRRPLSSLRTPTGLDHDPDAEVEGDEEEEPEEEQEEQVQPDAKRSKLGSTHEAQAGLPDRQGTESRSESRSTEYSCPQRTPQTPASALPQQPQRVGLPHHPSQPGHTNPVSSFQPQLSPGHAGLHTARTTATSHPQDVHSSPQSIHASPQTVQTVHVNSSTVYAPPGVPHHSPSPRLTNPSPHGAHASPQAINTTVRITHPSHDVYTSPERAHLQPRPQAQNPNPISTMLTRAPPPDVNTSSGSGASGYAAVFSLIPPHPRPLSYMSAPDHNPDTRPLPPGFVTQYDKNYNAWFYVNTNANPPTPQWTHPADDQKPSYAPPSGPPPGPSGGPGFPQAAGSPYPQSNSPYPPQSNSPYPPQNNPPYGQQTPYAPSNGPYGGPPENRGWGNSPSPSGQWNAGGGSWNQGGGWGQNNNYGGTPPPQQSTKGGAAGLLGKLMGGGKHGSSSGGYGGGYGGGPGYGGGYGGGYVQQQQAPKKSGGMGAGGMLLAGGAGLLGGALIADAISDHDQEEYAEGYAAGMDDGGGFDDF
ncbi:TOX high mobility group box family member 4 [Bos taurus] [Rhizoctonia solani]|uniref:TOX high mobility group box family member 4 [Bos taurus] n=1 Tax=Rhizoctonia solani TaxID=456999 RepID=A0A0K6FW33_9AGAM|nr:TOX high mobility group box family member 4 [Bos taurus] [Rhizoctonia solani]